MTCTIAPRLKRLSRPPDIEVERRATPPRRKRRGGARDNLRSLGGRIATAELRVVARNRGSRAGSFEITLGAGRAARAGPRQRASAHQPSRAELSPGATVGLVLTALGFLWTLPNTILGLVAGLLTFQVPRVERGVLVFDRAARGFSLLVPLFGYRAMTLGFVVIGAGRVEEPLLAHEREHVRQYCRWGPLFLPAYGLLFLRYGHARHPFELAADHAARQARS